MRVILFGASGMVGQGVLRECLADPEVTEVLAVTRQPMESRSLKVTPLVHEDFFDWSGVEERFARFDVCLFCLGVSALGMSEAEYRRTTFELTMSVAAMLARVGSLRTFEYVSGQGTNAQGKQMWARVKGETENALMAMPFEQIFCLRPGFIQPMQGVKSKTGWYRALYALGSWTYPVLRRLAPGAVTNTEELARVMMAVARAGYAKRVLETADIHVVASG